LWSALCLALALSAFAADARAEAADGERIRQQMSAEEFKAAGLDKLSPAELAALDAWLARRQAVATLGAAEAERILEQGREEGRLEVKEKSRGFLDFGSDEPIKSTLVGDFSGFAQGRRYTLANGQVWEQIEPAVLAGVKRTDPAVTIKPGLLNVWYLRLDGFSPSAKVRRIK
jgi:hypothetical protein